MKKKASLLIGMMLAMAPLANAHITIPSTCGVCRLVSDETKFFQCLAECLTPANSKLPAAQQSLYPAIAIATTNTASLENARREASWTGWRFDKTQSYVTKESLPQEDTFGRKVFATVTLSPHHGQKGIRFQMKPYSFSILTPEVVVVLDNGTTWNLKPNRYSNRDSVWVTDTAFLQALRQSQRMEMRVTPFGEDPQSFIFDMKGVKVAMDAIWPGGF